MQLQYVQSPDLTHLKSVQTLGYGIDIDTYLPYAESLAPTEFHYTRTPELKNKPTWQPYSLPTAFHGGPYQFVDLYGEGLPGILYKEEDHYYYRAPQRATEQNANNPENDSISYAEAWSPLDILPVGGLANQHATLMDITGDGQLDCVITQPGLQGFFSLNPSKQFQTFIPFAAFPNEFLHPQGQLIDIMGAGLSDLVLVGPNSVRIYPNQRQQGFGVGQETLYTGPGTLPLFQAAENELVAFSNLLGSSSPHLVHIQAKQITCWPNLGQGHFGNPITWEQLTFDSQNFDPKRLYLADLDGSGVTDLIYAHSDHLQIFPNNSGNGLAAPYDLPFPSEVTYDALTQLSFADVHGQGTACLILTRLAGADSQHWLYDFNAGKKPYLLESINNNSGLIIKLKFRSSSQEWLDEKQENPNAVSYLPFPIQLLSRVEQEDQITGNRQLQTKQYRQGYYDSEEREFNGFGLVISHDSERKKPNELSLHPTAAPLCSKTWYFTGRPSEEIEQRTAYYTGDTNGQTLAASLCVDPSHQVLEKLSPRQQQEFVNSLRGNIRRQETYGL